MQQIKSKISRKYLVTYGVPLLGGVLLILQPVLADDLLFLLSHQVNYSNLTFFNQIIEEYKAQSISSVDRFLPVGWLSSSILLTLAGTLSDLPLISLNHSWSIIRLILIIFSSILFMNAFTKTVSKIAITKSQYFLLLALTIQLHALWGHDAILSYTSTVYTNLILICSYIIVASSKPTISRVVLRLILITLGVLNYELFLSIIGFILYEIVRNKRNKILLRFYLVDIFILLSYALSLVIIRINEIPEYTGIQIAPNFYFIPISSAQIVSGIPFINVPFFIQSLLTEKVNFSLLLAIIVAVFFLFKKFDALSFLAFTQKIVFSKFFGFISIYVLSCVIISFSAKYQNLTYIIPGFTYTQYTFAWLLSPFVVANLATYYRNNRFLAILKSMLMISFIIFVSTSVMIIDKFDLNYRVVDCIENPKSLAEVNSVLRAIDLTSWEKEYRDSLGILVRQNYKL